MPKEDPVKKYLLLLVSVIVIGLYPVSETQAKSAYALTNYKAPVSTTHVWKQTFKEKVSKKSVTTKNIYLTEYNKSTRIPVSLTLLSGSKTIQIKPKKALKSGKKYTLIIKNMKSTKGKALTKKPIKKVFSTKKSVKTASTVKPQFTPILSTQVKTTSKTVTGIITEQSGKVSITYDFRNFGTQDLVDSSSLVSAKNYTLTYTKVPDVISPFMTGHQTEKLIKGENNLFIAEKLKEKQITLSLVQLLLGNFSIEGTLTDEAGNVTPITITFIME